MELNPAFAPGADGLGDGTHGSEGDLLYSQPPLPGIERPVPDFIWITRNSEDLIPVLIEIKTPTAAEEAREGVARRSH
jgi:hypothetical protein